jgi:hypothetical protein
VHGEGPYILHENMSVVFRRRAQKRVAFPDRIEFNRTDACRPPPATGLQHEQDTSQLGVPVDNSLRNTATLGYDYFFCEAHRAGQ